MLSSKRALSIYQFDAFRLDVGEQLLLCGSKPVALTPKAFATLTLLVEKGGSLVEKEEMLRRIWPDTFVEESTLARNVSDLRKALGKASGGGKYIETVPKRGYRFAAKVTALPAERPELQIVAVSNSDAPREPAVLNRPTNRAAITAVEPVAMQQATAAPDSLPVIDVIEGEARPADRRRNATPRERLIREVPALLLFGAATVAIAVSILLLRINRAPFSATAFQKIAISRIANLPGYTRAVISPDGKYVAYVIEQSEQPGLWVKYLPTASTVQVLPAPPVPEAIAFSPEGDYIFYTARETTEAARALYRVPALGGPPERILAGIESPITFSPDGTRFAFVRENPREGESALIIANADGSSERMLATRNLPDYFDYPAWSPDGSVIACTAVAFGNAPHSNVVEVKVKDGGERVIGGRNWTFLIKLAWFRDGSGLVMSARSAGSSGFQVWRLSYPRGDARRVTNDLNSYLGVSLTADSGTIITVQENTVSSLWVVPSRDTGRARQITSLIGKYSGVSWMPDGRIVYAYKATDTYRLGMMSPEGEGQVSLTPESEDDCFPVVSPDGRYVVFVSDRNGVPGIWKMDKGGRPELLTGIGSYSRPQCSADSKWLVYTAPNGSNWSALWRVALDGGAPEPISDAIAFAPAVSPDGKYIACFYGDDNASTQAAPRHIGIIPLGGGPPVRMLAVPEHVSQGAGIRWTPDGNAVAYVTTTAGVSNLWRLPLDGGAPRQITDFTGERIFDFDWSKDGERIICSRGTMNYDIVSIAESR